METTNEEVVTCQEKMFKERLVKIGLLTEITAPIDVDDAPQDRHSASVVGNSVSDLVNRERR